MARVRNLLITLALTGCPAESPVTPEPEPTQGAEEARSFASIEEATAALESGDQAAAIFLAEQVHDPDTSDEDVVEALAGLQAAPQVAAARWGLDRASGNSPVHNRIRIHAMRMLGATGSEEAVEPLASVVDDSRSHILIRRLAVESLGQLRSESALPVLLRALYIADRENPAMRMNDAAALALLQLGEVAVQPLLEILDAEPEGAHDDILTLTEAYVGQVLTANSAVEMNPREVRMGEALYVLGALGDPRAAPRLVELSADEDSHVSLGAMMAAARLVPTPPETFGLVDAAIQDADRPAYERAQLLALMVRLPDNRAVSVCQRIAEGGDELPLRYQATNFFWLLATATEAGRFSSAEDIPMNDSLEALASLSERCNDLACYRDMLDPGDHVAFEKASAMLIRVGDQEPETIDRFFGALRTGEIMVRRQATQAIDRLLVTPTQAQADALRHLTDTLEVAEAGRASWHAVQSELRIVVERVAGRVQ